MYRRVNSLVELALAAGVGAQRRGLVLVLVQERLGAVEALVSDYISS